MSKLPWLLDAGMASDPQQRQKALALLELLASPPGSGSGSGSGSGGGSSSASISAAQLVQDYGTAVYVALGLWIRARRWPLIPARFYDRAVELGHTPDQAESAEGDQDHQGVQRLLERLPRHSTEAVESVAREAVQLLYVAPMVAGHTTHELATLLAPAFLWVRTAHPLTRRPPPAATCHMPHTTDCSVLTCPVLS